MKTMTMMPPLVEDIVSCLQRAGAGTSNVHNACRIRRWRLYPAFPSFQVMANFKWPGINLNWTKPRWASRNMLPVPGILFKLWAPHRFGWFYRDQRKSRSVLMRGWRKSGKRPQHREEPAWHRCGKPSLFDINLPFPLRFLIENRA